MKSITLGLGTASACLLLLACGGGDGASETVLPRLSAAQPGSLARCLDLAARFSFPSTRILSTELVPSGGLSNAGQPVGEHCRVTGKMNERVSAVDGQTYAIGFEMRLPKDWAGRFLYQGNGGTDGVVVLADGASIGSGGMLRHALQMGMAVISSDAGHNAAQNPLFGLDPQARLDYGYKAVGSLTPMAKALIQAAYGKEPDRSYIAGTSNGGRHAMVAASRYATLYDGVLAHSPGFNLPRSAVANLSNVKLWDTVVTTRVVNNLPDYESALPASERQVVANAILARCDALDGLSDGLVQDLEGCQKVFDPIRDIPSCSAGRDGSCLTATQKTVLAKVYEPVRNSAGDTLYSGFPFDPGIAQVGWADWKFRNSLRTARNPVSVGYIFSSPPRSDLSMATDTNKSAAFALSFNLETEAPKIFATSGIYTESGMSFMTLPNPFRFDTLRERGGKMMVIHGAADPIFSVDDTLSWYRNVNNNYGSQADRFTRVFVVPGMGHSRGGPATDQYDALTALIDWVEAGKAPERLVAMARGAGNVGGVNTELPSTWSATRTRPLCPYPLVARYQSGNPELADSFACKF
ncbi:tannase/feruloyl esterase family alpha/beta hydrolase [Curvibacter sp. RS43]|uniref:tannase/feruloyl esterase family alpha/beta hydrolase n=1 Tax=Curvibacter microcysteis TaxID=3026419 RepID=UPI002361D9A9|nr:tannase/feruloyl esterase family alpha/beta hydrolase [Curvibacter sp. RS43]MDD0808984.1 tannase/feruloyl esterase family alpha/beta hydrolase [Curvibacter sp. RS43]